MVLPSMVSMNEKTGTKGKLNMETIIEINFFVFLVVGTICSLIGLDLKKWSSWLYGLYGFLTGFSVIFVSPEPNISSGLMVGTLSAFAVIFGGGMARRNKQLYTKDDLQSARKALSEIHTTAEKVRAEKKRKNK